MRDEELITLLAWAMPRLGLSWPAFRRFRGTIRKRLGRRLAELGLGDLAAYRRRLEADDAEWPCLDAMCRITISRLFRDGAVFDALAASVLPSRARAARDAGRSTVRAWSAGCASGEEPYTLAMQWAVDVAPEYPTVGLELVATDVDEALLERARHGSFGRGSLRELPPRYAKACLTPDGGALRVGDEIRSLVTFLRQDLRVEAPDGPFDLVLCRNLAFTYFEPALQRRVAERLVARLAPGGTLVLGRGEALPDALPGVTATGPWMYARA